MKNFMKTILSAVQTWTGGKIKDSTADWNQNDESADNYVKNRTHWEEIKEVAFLSETALNNFEQWEDGIYGSAFNYSQKLTVGQSYTVVWDGVQYNNLVCYNDGDGCLAIGAPYGDFSKYNFGIDYFVPDGALEFYTNSTEASHTISISATKTVVHKLDSKYIKDMYYDNGITITEVVPETTVEGFEVLEDPIYHVENAITMTPVVGATYVVNWDGAEYTVTCNSVDSEQIVYIGNENYINVQSGGDIPFLITFADGNVFLVTESTASSHTISVTEHKHDLKQLDIKYLPIVENVSKTVLEIDDVVSENEYEDPSYKLLIGKYVVIVDGISETVEFIDDVDFSFAESNSFYIEIWDGGIYFGFPDNEPHSVKIIEKNNFVKAEHIKDMYYEEDNRSTIYLKETAVYGFTEDSPGIYNARLFDSPLSVNGQFEVGKLYNVMWDGTEYLVEFCETEGGYYFGHDYYVSGWETDLPFGVWVNLDGTIGALSSNSDENRHNLSIYEGSYKIQKIDSKYLPTNLATAEDVRIVKQEAIDVANTAQATAETAQATADSKMDAANPVASDSFSMNRRSGTTIGGNSVAVGWKTEASGFASHAEGSDTIASGSASHAEGYNTKAFGESSHAEGTLTSTDPDSTPSASEVTIDYQRKGSQSHAEGIGTVAGGTSSHAEGNGTLSSGYVSHAEGIGTIADSIYQHAQGKFNIKDSTDTYAHIVGNGTSDTARSNAHTLDWNGVGWFQGGLQVGGTAQDDGAKNVLLEGDAIPVPAVATVGQLLSVKAVDENGKPTEWETTTVESSNVEIPTALPNPNTLTFIGAVEAIYDGSEAVSVEIPESGGTWEVIRDITLEEEVALNIIVTTKDNGEAFKYKKVACAVVVGDTALPGGWNNLAINPDPSHNGIWNGAAVIKRYFTPTAKKTYFFSYELMGDSVVNQYVGELGGNIVLSDHQRKGDSITEAAWVKAYETEITGVSYQVNGTFPVGARFIFYGMK